MAKDKIVFLDHKADVLFEASGKTFGEALENAAEAMFSVIADTCKVGGSQSVEVSERAESLEELAAFVLSDLLSEADSRQLFLTDFKVTHFDEAKKELQGKAVGGPMSPAAGETEVKAVTHHETKVYQKDGEWVVRVLLDV